MIAAAQRLTLECVRDEIVSFLRRTPSSNLIVALIVCISHEPTRSMLKAQCHEAGEVDARGERAVQLITARIDRLLEEDV